MYNSKIVISTLFRYILVANAHKLYYNTNSNILKGDKMDYHKRLKELRIKNNYTQAEIAYILQTRQEQYSKYENGKRELPIHHLVTLCFLYKVYKLPSFTF